MAEAICNQAENLVHLVNQLIIENHYDGIQILLQDNRNIDYLKENCPDFVEICKTHLTDDNFKTNFALYSTCEELLKTISSHAGVEEILFELLEMIDSTKSDNVFTSTLKALQICITRRKNDKKSLEWGFNEVQCYLSELEVPEFLQKGYGKEEEALLEQNTMIHKILTNYITVLLFYEPILERELKNSKIEIFKSTKVNEKNILICFLLQLLGKPLDFYRHITPSSSALLVFQQRYLSTNNLSKYDNQRISYKIPLNNVCDLKRCFCTKQPTTDPIDEFRAREEKKEEDFSKQESEFLSTKNTDENEENEKLTQVRSKILEASLPFVQQHGWSRKALTCGAEQAGYPGVAHGLFPDGAIDLIRYFYNKCNSDLVEFLKCETKNGETIPKEPSEFLVKAIQYRLEMLIPYKSYWPQALTKMALPQHVPKSLAQILTLTDDICYFSGDRSVDFGWYTRRVGLSAIYKITELYLLQDKSENHQNTWEFLKNRMSEAVFLEAVIGQTGEPSQRTKNKMSATFETARNILGLGYDRR